MTKLEPTVRRLEERLPTFVDLLVDDRLGAYDRAPILLVPSADEPVGDRDRGERIRFGRAQRVGVKLPRAASFLAKSELFEGRFFVGLIRMLNAFPVRQGRGDISAVREAINRLGQGSALVLFPEGTRTEDGELIHLEAGVGLIVRKTTAPVVPCAIEGSYRAWPRRRKMFRASPIRVMFGPPMELAGLKAQQIVDAIDATLRRMIVQLKQEIQAGDA